jgi:hypothetical protein
MDNLEYRLPVVTSTFHGRDLFSPAAAHLALGVPIDSIGPAIDPSDLVDIDWPPVVVADGRMETTVIYRDSFGNVKLGAVTADLLEALAGLQHGEMVELSLEGARPATRRMAWAPTFGDVAAGEYLLYEDSYGRLCIARNQGSAAESLPIDEDAVVTVRRVGQTTE